MSDDRIEFIECIGDTLTGWLTVNGRKIKISADRETIHRHAPGFNDALTWEIKRHAPEIFERLRPFFIAQHA